MAVAASMPLRLTICGLDEIAGHCAQGVTHVLDPRPGLAGARSRIVISSLGRRLKLNFHDVIEATPEWIAPEQCDVELLLTRSGATLATGQAMTEATPKRGSSICSSTAMPECRARRPRRSCCWRSISDRPARDIVGRSSGCARAWPNLRMVEIGDALLGRDGEIVAAVRSLYRLMLDRARACRRNDRRRPRP